MNFIRFNHFVFSLHFFLFVQKGRNFDFDTIILIVVAVTNPSWMFLHCFLGKMVTDRYDELSNDLYQSKWYNLPVELQKYFILMLANTQKPLFFDGLGIYVLDLETFASVS